MLISTYDKARNQINNGDIIFVRKKKTLVAKIIQFFTRSEYSHCAIAFWIEIAGVNRLMVVEAQGKTKRRILNLSFYKEFDLDVVKVPVPWDSYANEALSKIGVTKYGYISALYVGLREFLLKECNIKLPQKDVDSDDEICSEFIAKVLKLPETVVSPQGLWEELGKKVDIRIEV